ncbi:ATP-binding protein [Prolixibacteraceae bacterium Z1-6]|uniref:histidine kinase n=1 Tax=Draconibacterium aestuarii TaxID=2998507 RepID=A0A9X3J7R3_9BACT|nr:ATP-binding protein [Prolixibacteraceae bacterium Z1-6]
MIDAFPIKGLIQFCTALAALLVVAILWRFKKAAEVKYLIILEINIATWAIFYALEFFSPELATKTLWSQFSYFGIAFIPASYFYFTTAFSQKNKLINKRNTFLISLIPLATIVLVFTNQHHHLVWEVVTLSAERNMLLYDHGTWFWIFYTYTFLLIVSGIYNLFSSIYKFTAYYKSQIFILLIASLIPILANVIYVSKINPFTGFDWTTVSFVLTGIIIAFGIYRYKMFELVPLAKKKLLDTMSEGVIVINNKGLLEDINPAATTIFAITKKEALNSHISSVFKNYPPIIEAFHRQSESTLSLQIGKSPAIHFYQVKVSPILKKKKVLYGKLFVFNDVTSIRRAELELQNTNKQLINEIEKNKKLIDDLDSFAHTVAHDLKNSLGSIYSSSEVIIHGIEADDKETVKEISLLIKESAGKTIEVTNELLKLATACHHEVEKIPVDMGCVFKNAEKQLAEIITQKNVQVKVSGQWDSALGYAPWIEEVWVNYLSNAIKYGGNPAVISAGSQKINDNKIKFWISDNGDGIALENQDKLFLKYTRLDPNKASGYGLGLSIVKRIVEKLGGTVGVESTGTKGEGSTFYFILPAC